MKERIGLLLPNIVSTIKALIMSVFILSSWLQAFNGIKTKCASIFHSVLDQMQHLVVNNLFRQNYQL